MLVGGGVLGCEQSGPTLAQYEELVFECENLRFEIGALASERDELQEQVEELESERDALHARVDELESDALFCR